ncbi:hypothetical protein [Candidatus Pantoea multigeneris]|uniref:Uncharacterized protein n=1 Tax=Candidatus Pantoea multigeneris TaxID=2608357 RepID=A0ABX0RD65_9GAMM|nr:hypothetical protein [Pantoea multigeneris]NIF21624.1 hypothetical protein [Pantoea multigeneris]
MFFKYRIKRLNLLDQWRMDKYHILFSIFVSLVFTAMILWVFPLFAHGNTIDGLIGMLCGLSINSWMTCVSRLYINTPMDVGNIIDLLEERKYKKNAQGDYELSVKKFLEFKPQCISIKEHDDALVLTGPYNILKNITKILKIKK